MICRTDRVHRYNAAHSIGFINMDTYSLTNFLYICEYGSINKAAKAIHISQPSLTHQVQMLET
ncbi:MAG: LysR family transcriptional regulator, partial [Clostridia bacterium]|nr:LysR family transcriptional regulator [Clostridia bacterium]